METSNTSPVNKPATAYSCVRCFERKVKCDKNQPCAACERHNVDCIYRVPAPPRRRKKRAQEEILTERIKHYEHLLQQKGIDVKDAQKVAESNGPPKLESRTSTGDETKSPSSKSTGESNRQFVSSQLIFDAGRSRYLENNLWNRVTEEIGSPHDALDESSDSDGSPEVVVDDNIDYVLSITPSLAATRTPHPPPDQIKSLWQAFSENVDPICKLVHGPTLYASIERAMTNLDAVPRNLETLMFSIYTAGVLSLKDRDCEYQYGERKSVLLSRYRTATKAALSRMKFLGTSDIVVLQAFILHLLTMRDQYDSRTLWTLSGVASRIAEGMGIHRDGSALGVPPFETELRRRLWWQLAMLNNRSAELTGANKFQFAFGDEKAAKQPANVNDSDIYPGMTEPPVSREGVTDMIFASLRNEFGAFWSKKIKEDLLEGNDSLGVWGNYNTPAAIAKKDEAIDELLHFLEKKYIKYCDGDVPIQYLTMMVVKGATKSMRLMAHHPRRYPKDEDIPEKERQLLWSLSCDILELDSHGHTERKLSRYAWHSGFYFQWQALIYLLDCLRADPLLGEANKAWQIIDEVYENHPDFITNTKKPVHVAIGTLCVKAYHARETALAKEGKSAPTPAFITQLRRQREAAKTKQREREARHANQQNIVSDRNAISFPNDNTIYPQQQQQLSPNQQHPQLQQHQQSHTLQQRPPSLSQHPSFHQQQPQQLNHQLNPSTTQPFQSPSMQLQFPQPMWYSGLGMQQTSDFDMDFMLAQGQVMVDDNNAMDWAQWDTLLQDMPQ